MSTALICRSSSVVERHFGPLSRWCRDGALIGAWTGLVAAVLPLAVGLGLQGARGVELITTSFEVYGMYLLQHGLWCTTLGTVAGALLLGSAPFVLDRLRGRVPLVVIGAIVPVACAALVTPLVHWTVIPAELTWKLHYAGTCAFLQGGLIWLPYTMASMLGRGQRAVVVGTLGLTPVTVFLAALITALLPGIV